MNCRKTGVTAYNAAALIAFNSLCLSLRFPTGFPFGNHTGNHIRIRRGQDPRSCSKEDIIKDRRIPENEKNLVVIFNMFCLDGFPGYGGAEECGRSTRYRG